MYADLRCVLCLIILRSRTAELLRRNFIMRGVGLTPDANFPNGSLYVAPAATGP